MSTPNPTFMNSLSSARWLPYRIRRSLLKRIYPSALKSYSFETTIEGGLRCTGNLQNYIDRLIFFCGAHEKYMLYFLRDVSGLLRQERAYLTFMDIGANIGNHSLYMAKQVGMVYAFEPFAKVRETLNRHIEINGLRNVQVFPFALGEENAVLPFFSGSDENLGTASFCPDHHAGNQPAGSLEIRIGDEVAVAEKLQRIDLLKLDVEGFEPPVLRGLRETLKRDRPLMIVELTPTTRAQLGSEAVLKALFPENYTFWCFAKGDMESGAYRLAPFDYAKSTKVEDMIGIPEEMTALLKPVLN